MAPSRTQTLDRARARGLRILGTLPYHYPRALVRAHGFHPVEVWAPASARPDSGATHFQAYACSIVTRGTAFLVDGGSTSSTRFSSRTDATRCRASGPCCATS